MKSLRGTGLDVASSGARRNGFGDRPCVSSKGLENIDGGVESSEIKIFLPAFLSASWCAHLFIQLSCLTFEIGQEVNNGTFGFGVL